MEKQKRIAFLFKIFLPSFVFFAVLSVLFLLNFHPDISSLSQFYIQEKEGGKKDVQVTFLGTSSLLFQDGNHSVLIDGFFTRPSKWNAILRKVKPDESLIRSTLTRLNATKLDAVITVHSHYDHAMDSGVISRITGAKLIGSDSTANIGLGSGLEEKQIHRLKGKETFEFGKFKVTLIPSKHSPKARYEGEILSPLSAPAAIEEYKEGGSYSVLIEHNGKSVLVQGSAGFIEGGLEGYRADLVYLGVGGLGKNPENYREEYWKEVVEKTKAKEIILIHWDDFFLPLEETLKPLPPLFDDFHSTMEFILEKSKSSQIPVHLQERFQVHSF